MLVGCYEGVDSARGESAGLTAGSTTEGSEDTDPTGNDGSDSDDPVPDDYEPSPVSLRRLLASQYVESTRLLLGDAAAAAANPPDDAALNGFTAIGASQLASGSAEIDRYEASARAIAQAAMAPTTPPEAQPIDRYLDCIPSGSADAACMETFVASFGRSAFRHSLDDDELARYTAVGLTAASDFDDFHAGVQATMAAMLQSPLFLYQVETGEPDPDNPGHRRLKGPELATRLAFFLTGSTPDVPLLDAAEAGALDSADGIREAAESLVDQTSARQALHTFSSELLRLRQLPTLPKDSAAFPTYDAELAAAMQEETRLLIEHVAFELDGDFTEVFDADYTFVNDELAGLYGIDPPGGWSKVSLPESQQRSGVLTQAAWLAMMSHTNVNSPTRRGLFVLEKLLCTEVPLPPPRVNPEPVVPDEGLTLRETLNQHMADPACSTCHALTDPLGFAFENYDASGAYRTLDNGQPIDATGAVAGIGEFDGAAELAGIIASDERLPSCLVENVFTQGLGFVPEDGQLVGLERVSEAFQNQDNNMKQLLVELAASPVFRLVDSPK